MWQRKQKGRVHLMGSDGKTLCQLEKTGAAFPLRHHSTPPAKPLCKNCLEIERHGFAEPSVKVLMGEAMA